MKTNAGGITNSIIGNAFEAPVRSSPMVVGNEVYVGSLDGNLYSLSTSSGNIIWKFQTGGQILATPTIVDGAIYVASCNPGTYGIFLQAKCKRWFIDLER
jgi:outer membrane protein assembly factor BamB